MRGTGIHFVGFATLLLIWTPKGMSQQRITTGVVQGVVTVPGTNEPISNVKIQIPGRPSGSSLDEALGAMDKNSLTAVTDAQGRFTIAGVPLGTMQIRAELSGYFVPSQDDFSPAVATPVVRVVPQGVSEVHIFLVPGCTLSGRVIDSDGKVFVNAKVQALRQTFENGFFGLRSVSERTTDDRGEFRLFRLPPGTYFLTVTPPVAQQLSPEAAVARSTGLPQTTLYPNATNVEAAVAIVAKAGEERSGIEIRVNTGRSVRISGRVVSSFPAGPVINRTGQERDSSAVLAITPHNSLALPTNISSLSITANSTNGRFTIENVPPGTYDLYARLPVPDGWGTTNPPGRATAPWAIGKTLLTVNDQDIDNIVVNVRQGEDLTGRITLDGKAIARVF